MDWPPDYSAINRSRLLNARTLQADELVPALLRRRYERDPVAFITEQCVTFDPRNAGTDKPTTMPFVLFPKQVELVEFLHACMKNEASGLIEKCRDAGATWVSCAFSVWAWLYVPGSAIGWGSRKEQLVDKLGVVDSIFEKMRMIVRYLPPELLPAGFIAKDHMTYMRFLNPENGNTIVGEAGDNIGRGGRTLIYFKDESAHYERPELIEAALADNTNCQIDISSVNGVGNVFHRRREAGQVWSRGADLARNCANIFIFDWRDHPAKDQAWYDRRKAKAEADGLSHIFAQEVDRDYTSALEGAIIPSQWVRAAIDAHIKLGFEATGIPRAGLDIADEGGDKNALATGIGPVLTDLRQWGQGDVGQTTREAVQTLTGQSVAVQYDSVGVGAGVKAEANRLVDAGEMPEGLSFVAWGAGSRPLFPDDHLIAGDHNSPVNKDYFANIKAQAWWQLRLRFERTFKAVTQGIEYDPAELISLPSELELVQQLVKELSQATRKPFTSTMKLVVDKQPDGTASPNLADAVVMAFWPIDSGYDWGVF